MAQKLLKTKKSKVASKNDAVQETSIVLVGPYRADQMKKWILPKGYYNYPVGKEDDCTPAHCKLIKELWLYKGKSARKVFSAEFIGVKTRAELPDYPATKTKPHGEKYLLFKVKELYGPQLENATVHVRVSDFTKRTPKIAAAIKAFQEGSKAKPKSAKHLQALGAAGILAEALPNEIAQVPPERLCVREAAVQLDFFRLIDPVSVALKQTDGQGKYKIASLFAGCGGLDLGFVGGFDFLGKKFARTGFEVVWANELNPAACRTYERNLGGHIVCGDIKDVINSIPKGVDVVMGGFPCQDISINGKMLGIKGRRSCLYTYIVDAVKKLRPKVFVAENVGSLMMKQNEYSFKTILSDFQSLGYDITYHVYHAEKYGVPQTRERIVFVGTRSDMPKFVHPLPSTDAPITAGEALRDLESCSQSKEFSHVWSVAAPSGEQGSRRMIEDRPGYTIRAECHGNIQFHYRLPRRISMREAARIQSFPDSFVFPCGIRETERQIGNAVPPVLAWHIAESVKCVLDNNR